jgi:hypothetical protein
MTTISSGAGPSFERTSSSSQSSQKHPEAWRLDVVQDFIDQGYSRDEARAEVRKIPDRPILDKSGGQLPQQIKGATDNPPAEPWRVTEYQKLIGRGWSPKDAEAAAHQMSAPGVPPATQRQKASKKVKSFEYGSAPQSPHGQSRFGNLRPKLWKKKASDELKQNRTDKQAVLFTPEQVQYLDWKKNYKEATDTPAKRPIPPQNGVSRRD